MSYKVKFPSKSIERKFGKVLSGIQPVKIQKRIMDEVEALATTSRPYGKKLFKVLKPPKELSIFTASYRIRVGDYRVLYDVDDSNKTVWILALRRRSERTYK